MVQQKFLLLKSNYLIFYLMMMMMMMTMVINCFCGMVDQRKAFSLISRPDDCQRFSPLEISDTPRAGIELSQNLSSGFGQRSCAVVITTTPRHQSLDLLNVTE